MIYFLFSLVFAKEVMLKNSYNGKFAADIRGKGRKAVIFVHDDGASKSHFEGLAVQMASRNLRTVNFNLVGHGERKNVHVVDPFMYLDIQTIIKELRDDGVRDVQCVGAGLGGILCMQAISEQTPMSQVAIISPASPVRHLSLFTNIDSYPQFPVFVIAADQDPIALPTILKLEEKREVILLNPSSTERGTILLVQHPELEKELRDWIWKKSKLMRKRPPIKLNTKIKVEGENLPF